METLGYLLGLVSFIWLWDTKLLPHLLLKQISEHEFRARNHWLNNKPLNCAPCLTGWVGIIMFACTLNIFFLSLPILYKILTK